MINILYPVTSLVAIAVLFLLFQYHKTNTEKSESYLAMSLLLIFAIIFCSADALWGIVGSGIFVQNTALFWVSSLGFHTMASVTPFIFYRYTAIYLDFKRNIVFRIFEFVPLVLMAVILLSTVLYDSVFVIDENYVYHSGNLRMHLFILQYCYFVLGLIVAIVKMNKADNDFKRSRCNTIIISLLIPMGSGILQLWFPDAPCYAIGYLVSSVAVFTGNVSVEREKNLWENTEKYKDKSMEIYRALEALAKSYVSIHLFDLEQDKQEMVHSNPQIESFVNPEDTAHDQIKKVMAGLSDPSCVDEIVKFVDTYTLPERLKNARVISQEFIGHNQGYCISHFFVAERNSNGVPIKVIHAVQNVDDTKRKELEYERTIKEALENENAIYAELLQMQETGVVVTDENKQVIVFNNKLKEIMGKQNEDIFELDDFVNVAHYENEEETVRRFSSLSQDGGSYEFYFWTQFEDAPRTYCLASAKCIELKNKRKYVVTSVTDITRNKQMENMLLELSETDALTGINNRGSGEAKIDSSLANGKMGLFCILDVDDFKSINDSFGHTTGDEALVAIAESMKATFRDNDIIMRLGGDEFAVFAAGIDNMNTAELVIQRFFKKIESVEIPEMNGKKITVSLGAVFSDAQKDIEFDDIYKKADSVMYECKRIEGNNFKFYTEE